MSNIIDNFNSGVKKIFSPKNISATNDYGLRALSVAMLLGLAGIIAACYAVQPDSNRIFWSNIGFSLLIALAAIISGGFLGFLFGIPRSLQRSDANNTRAYGNNTNLEQISDWLTKIIVGVSLTQINTISKNFNTLLISIERGFCRGTGCNLGYAYASLLIVFYSVCGFMFVYLWSKIYLLMQLAIVEKDLDGLTLNQVSEEQKRLKIAQLEASVESFNRQKNRLLENESDSNVNNVLANAKPGAITVLDDGQKNRWGGKSENGGYRLSASFAQNESHTEGYIITLSVTSANPQVNLSGDVYFFLHDSYYPNSVRKVTAVNGIATLTVISYEAFTVGAVCLNGEVKLELDLNQSFDCPGDYKYIERLANIEEINEELKKLKNSLAPDL